MEIWPSAHEAVELDSVSPPPDTHSVRDSGGHFTIPQVVLYVADSGLSLTCIPIGSADLLPKILAHSSDGYRSWN